MSDDLLDAATAALRATSDVSGEPEDGAATRLRVRRSLETRAHGHRQLLSVLTVVGVLCFGTVSWALSTGRWSQLWHSIVDAPPIPPPVDVPLLPEAARRTRVKRPTAVAAVAPDATTAPAVAAVPQAAAVPEVPPVPEVVADPPAPSGPAVIAAPAPTSTATGRSLPRTAPAVVEAPRPPVVRTPRVATTAAAAPARERARLEAQFRAAHELHFHGGDHVASLAAWDAYLAASPTGRFVVEARYNRALVLIRLARYAEARVALAPFARGEVSPAGYRQAEASKLLERLSAQGTPRGDYPVELRD